MKVHELIDKLSSFDDYADVTAVLLVEGIGPVLHNISAVRGFKDPLLLLSTED